MSAQLSAKVRRPGRELRDSLTAQSWVSRRNGRPFCLLRWGKKEGRLTPAEMRQLGVAFIQVAAAAESDAALMATLREETGLDERMSVQVLATVQGHRRWAALAAGELTAHSGCPYPGAHLQPEDLDEEPGEDGAGTPAPVGMGEEGGLDRAAADEDAQASAGRSAAPTGQPEPVAA